MSNDELEFENKLMKSQVEIYKSEIKDLRKEILDLYKDREKFLDTINELRRERDAGKKNTPNT